MKKLIFFELFVSLQLFSQPAGLDTTYMFEMNATASPLISFFREERFPGSGKEGVLGYSFTTRVMWHPARRLAVGLMTGYTSFSKENIPVEGIDKPQVHLSAVPLQAVVSMQKGDLEAGVGMGPYLMISKINFKSESVGRRLELGLTFFCRYTFLVFGNINIGPEMRFLYMSYRGILSVMPSLTVLFDLLRY